MKLQTEHKEHIVLFVSIIFSIFLSTILWKYITFSYSDPKIIGIYSLNNYDAKNDIFRYIFFVFLPIFTYLGIKFFFHRNFFDKIKFFLKKENNLNIKIDNSLILIFFTLIILLFLDFLSLDFPHHKIDSFHDGQRLSSAYKNYLDGSLWSGSYVTVGIFYETLSSKLIWEIFDHVSIGLARFADFFLVFILKLCLVFLCFRLTKFLNLKEFYKNIYFLFNSLIFLSLTDYNSTNTDLISFREIPIISLFILFTFLFNKNYQTFVLFLISFLSISSLMWGIDRGLICNLLIMVIFIYLFFIGEHKKILISTSFIIFFWFLFYLILGDEFNYFLKNTISVYKEMNYVHGLIHPTPFSAEGDAARATKTIISIILCLLIALSLIFNSSSKFYNAFKIILLFLAIISFASYVYALGRSDGPHIRSSFGYPIIFISIYFSYICIFKISKNSFKISELYKNIIISVIFLFFLLISFNLNANNIFNYKKRFTIYSFLPDTFFLNDDEAQFVKKIKPSIENYDCIQLFSNDAIFNYLLRKKSCTKFYFVWSASSLKKQNEFISELDDTDIIISNGPKDNWDLPLSEKLFLVKKHIKENYYKHQSINEWDILLIKK